MIFNNKNIIKNKPLSNLFQKTSKHSFALKMDETKTSLTYEEKILIEFNAIILCDNSNFLAQKYPCLNEDCVKTIVSVHQLNEWLDTFRVQKAKGYIIHTIEEGKNMFYRLPLSYPYIFFCHMVVNDRNCKKLLPCKVKFSKTLCNFVIE